MLKLVYEEDAEGLQSDRPDADSVASGYVYFAEDINQYSISDNTQWINPDNYNAGALLVALGLVMQGGGGSAGGSSTQLQFNNSSAFGGTSGLVWNSSTSRLSVQAGASPVAPLQVGSGDSSAYNGVTTIAQNQEVRGGTVASPQTNLNPLLKVTRYISVDDPGSYTGDGASQLAAFASQIRSTGTGAKAQPVGGFFHAVQEADGDAAAIYGQGVAGADGVGIGCFLFAQGNAADSEANALELVVSNMSGAAITWDPTDGRPTFSGIWLNAFGDDRCGAAIAINNSFSQTFDVGIGITGANGVTSQSFYDAGNATTSINIQGTHTNAIVVGNLSGNSAFGTTTLTNIRLRSTLTNNTNDSAALNGSLNNSTAGAGNITSGVWGSAEANNTSGTHGRSYGVRGTGFMTGSGGTAAHVAGGAFTATITAGTIGTSFSGVHILANTVSAGTVPLNAGLRIEAQTGGTQAAQIYSAGSAPSMFAGTMSIGTTSAPNASCLVDLVSTTLGLGVMAMTEAQRDAISSPRAGLLIYNTTTNKLNVRVAAAWEAITSA